MENDLWQKTLFHLDKGNFTELEEMLGASGGFDRHIIEWHESGKFNDHPHELAEALTCACMLGRAGTAEYLLDNNVDPIAGMKAGLNGFHYAASGGRLDVIKLLIANGVPMEIESMYGGTVLGQPLWSAIHEHKDTHAEVIELLLDAGAKIEDGTVDWWLDQDLPDENTKQRVLDSMRRYDTEYRRT